MPSATGTPNIAPASALARLAALDDITVFHAGTARSGDDIVTAGGRVLDVVATGPTIDAARDMESIRAWEASPSYANLYLAAVSPYIAGAMSVSLCEIKVFEAAGLAAALSSKS